MTAAGDVSSAPELPRLATGLRPLIDAVAGVPASVHSKLRAGFLCGALLLVAMALASLAVQAHIAGRVDELNLAQERLDDLRQMDYLVTAQSHYRTMSLLTRDDSYVGQIAQAKAQFAQLLDAIEPITPSAERGVVARVREADQRYAVSGQQVLALYQAGRIDDALSLHLSQEHPISHEIEAAMGVLLDQAEQQMADSRATVASDQRLLTDLFIGFSVASLLTALLLGFILSWSFLLPLGTIHRALERMAVGRFNQHVALPNRDEFGALARNLNTTSQELATMYGQLESLNVQLRGTNTDLLAQLQARVEELDRSRGMITEAEERLRREIAEVLHSRVQNRLLMIWYRLEEAQALVETDRDGARTLLAEIREQLEEVREQDVRELSHRLHPSIIRAGLLPALETLADEMAPLEVTIDVDAALKDLDDAAHNQIPEAVRLTAYRVVEEALGNALKHGAATHVRIGLRAARGGLQLEIADDGKGFDQAHTRAGLGLGSMAARVGRIGGTWTIRSAPGDGTRITVELPCSIEQVQDSLSAQAVFGQEGGADPTGHRAVAGGH
ncbi:MAG: HAMP domain-containing protein [Chloroflexi bacterium]|nr:HAMP domain-containing protein [Chloroflexota bacterium]MBV9597910.1 HAMP domain-containing protein [Chloroflexota bacterium]